jgi:hypothetical protein
MLADYLEKIEKLSILQLEGLVERYTKTISSLQRNRDDAQIVALTSLIEFNDKEIQKKKAELAVIQQILANHPDKK